MDNNETINNNQRDNGENKAEEVNGEESHRQTDFEKMEEKIKERGQEREKRNAKIRKEIDSMYHKSSGKKPFEKDENDSDKTSENKGAHIKQDAKYKEILASKNELFHKNKMSWIKEGQKAKEIIKRTLGVSSHAENDFLDALKKYSRRKIGNSTLTPEIVKEFEYRVKHGFNGEIFRKLEKKGEINRKELRKTIGKRTIIRKLTDAMIGGDHSHR